MKKTALHFKSPTKFSGLFVTISILFFSQLILAGDLFIEGGLDRDGDGRQEFLIWSPLPGDSTFTYVEYTDQGLQPVWAWSYRPEHSARITDVKLADVTHDGQPDIVAISRSIYGSKDKKEPWLMVFPAEDTGFSTMPLSLTDPLDGTGRTRPTALDILWKNNEPNFIISEGTPNRQAMMFQLAVDNNELSFNQNVKYAAPLISSGYGQVFAQGLNYESENYIVLFSVESNLLKTAIFASNNPEPLQSDVLVLNGARTIIGSGITHKTDFQGNQILLIPFKTGEVMALQWDGSDLNLSATEEFSPFLWPGDASTLNTILANYSITKKDVIQEEKPVAIPLNWEPQFADTVKLGDSFTYSIAPDSGASFYSFTWQSPPPKGSELDLYDQSIKWTPERKNLGIHLFAFAQESRLNEIVTQIEDEYGFRHQLTPELEKSESVFTILVQDTIDVITDYEDSTIFEIEEPRMFSLIVTTPSEMENDRFRFEGVSPFGIMVHESKEIPGTGKKLVGHDILADLNRIAVDSQVSFRYFSGDTSQAPVTTLTIIHDLESNVMFMSASPSLDTVRQSFHPEAWDPELYGYPEYFFEGFPASMKMDSSRQSLVFSFDEKAQTNILNSSVMMMSPLNPNHWLSLYMDDGALVEIRGEVKVKENKTKKLIINIDFSGDFFPQMLRTRTAPYSGEIPTYSTPAIPLPVRELLEIKEALKDSLSGIGEPEPIEEQTDVIEELPADTSLVSEPTLIEETISDSDTLLSIIEDTLQIVPDTTILEIPIDTTSADSLDQ